MRGSRSVVRRTIILHLVAIFATSILMPLTLYLMLRRSAIDLHDQALRAQAEEIRSYVRTDHDGKLRLALPHALTELYSAAYGRYAYAVIDAGGRVLFSSLGNDEPIIAPSPPPTSTAYFTTRHDGADLHGVSLPVEIDGRLLSIQVSQDLLHRDVLIDNIVADFFPRVGWITAPILLLLLLIDVAIFRGALRPIVAASALAERIGPTSTDLRLPEAGIPKEVLPLVQAVNRALERLEGGFRSQREFTADAAHELRTPLAILHTQIDMLPDRDAARSLRADVENMARLVNQLLEMAELETAVIGADETADLVAVSAETAAFLAPLALSQHRDVAVSAVRSPVLVRGNADTIGRAVRNLVENGLAHTRPGTTVEIIVDPAGAVRVCDHGPGVPAADREHIFRRFWRRERNRTEHGGLGLSIVARIAQMHGGTVLVTDAPGGGAEFTLQFPATLASEPIPFREARPEPVA